MNFVAGGAFTSPSLQGEGRGGDGSAREMADGRVGWVRHLPIPIPAFPLKGKEGWFGGEECSPGIGAMALFDVVTDRNLLINLMC